MRTSPSQRVAIIADDAAVLHRIAAAPAQLLLNGSVGAVIAQLRRTTPLAWAST